MKPVPVILIFVLIAGCCLSACKKESPRINPDFVGAWEIEQYHGEPFLPPYPPGNGNVLTLYADGKVERKAQGVVTESGQYDVKRKDEHCRQEDISFITFYFPGYKNEYHISLHEGKLNLSAPCNYACGGTGIYRKL